MTTIESVRSFLAEFKGKLSIWNVLYRDDRGKNSQALLDLEITPRFRTEILEKLTPKDFSQGPIEEVLYNGSDMWVFGKVIKGKEVYIKITLGPENSRVVCISFHIAEHTMNYPFKI